MPTVNVNNTDLHYRSVGQGKETIVFSHGYLMDNTMFDGQIEAFKDRFRCIAFDHRGHGKSEVTKEGYEIDNLTKDAIGLIENLELGAVHFVGLSTGGFVGMRIALRRPELLKSLILMDTSAEGEDKNALKQYNLLLWMIKKVGWFAVIGQVMPILFHKTFLKDTNRKAEVKKWRNIITGHDKKGVYAFGKGIFSRNDVLPKLSTIKVPTAVIVGEHDVATPPKLAKKIVEAIPHATYYEIADAGHSSTVEQPAKVVEAMKDFYKKI